MEACLDARLDALAALSRQVEIYHLLLECVLVLQSGFLPTCLTNQAPEPRLAEIIMKEISNARKVVNAKEHVERRQPVTKLYFQETLDSLRGAVMIAFPQGLPEWVRPYSCYLLLLLLLLSLASLGPCVCVCAIIAFPQGLPPWVRPYSCYLLLLLLLS